VNSDDEPGVLGPGTRDLTPDEEGTGGRGWDVAKVAGGLSVIVYGALFLAYRTYYAPLNLSPEDAGVTSSFVLVRSIGFVVLVIIASAPPLVAFALLNEWERRRGNPGGVAAALRRYSNYRYPGLRRAYVVTIALTACYAWYLFAFFGVPVQGGPFAIVTIVLAIMLVLLAVMRWSANLAAFQWLTVCATISVTAVVLPLALTIATADDYGAMAKSGQSIASFDVFGLPVLDVSAPPISVIWADPRTPHATEIFGTQPGPTPVRGILIAQTNNAIYVNVGSGATGRVIRFDPRQVIIAFGTG